MTLDAEESLAEHHESAPPAAVVAVPLAGGEAVPYTVRSPARETANEDAWGIVPLGERTAVVVVADGVGGERGGAAASRLAVATLIEAVTAVGDREDRSLRAAILDGIERANHAILESGSGATTLAVVEIDRDEVRSYHVGDSLILHIGQRGRLKYRALAHGPVGYGVEAGLIDGADALHHEELHVVSNVVGSTDMRIEIGPRRALGPRDTVLLATDGLSDNLYLEEIVEAIRRGPATACADRLVESAVRRMTAPEPGGPNKPDDLTFVLFRPTRSMVGRRRADPSTSVSGIGRSV